MLIMKSKLLLGAMALFISFSVVACSGSKNDSKSEETTEYTVSETTICEVACVKDSTATCDTTKTCPKSNSCTPSQKKACGDTAKSCGSH